MKTIRILRAEAKMMDELAELIQVAKNAGLSAEQIKMILEHAAELVDANDIE